MLEDSTIDKIEIILDKDGNCDNVIFYYNANINDYGNIYGLKIGDTLEFYNELKDALIKEKDRQDSLKEFARMRAKIIESYKDYTYRDSCGIRHKFKCRLGDVVTILDDGYYRIGEVEALDDDGYITIRCNGEVIRRHNDNIIEDNMICGRHWVDEVNFIPNTNWQKKKHYRDDEANDWIVGVFDEGTLWMNNAEGYIVLEQANGVCLYDVI